MEELKFPVGRYNAPAVFTKSILENSISVIEQFPAKLKREVEGLTQEQLDTPYRPEGWTIRQVVNHCADSHANALIRVKLALTENSPVITAYVQDLWSELADSKQMPIHPALLTLEGLHARWVVVLKSLSDTEWKKEFIHPEKGRALNLEEATGSYAWHCEHHLAHITQLKKRMSWK